MAKSKYHIAKEAFLKIENPYDKLRRLHRESNETWDAHQRASDAERDFIKTFEDEMIKYRNEEMKVTDLVKDFEERLDSMSLNPPKNIEFDDLYPF